MDWSQVAIFAIGIFGLFIWNRLNRRKDLIKMKEHLDDSEKILKSIYTFRKELNNRGD